MLTQEKLDTWITALRSGKYTQIKAEYKTPERAKCFCAVGLYFKSQKVPVDKSGYFDNERLNKTEEDLNITFPAPSGKDNRLYNLIIVQNDAGQSFAQIADWLEENVKLPQEVPGT